MPHPGSPTDRSPTEALPLSGKAVFVIEDEPLIAMNVQAFLEDAGAGRVEIADSLAVARHILTGGGAFDAAVVDLYVRDGDATPLVEMLAARGVPVLVTTGVDVGANEPALGAASAILRKPYADADFIAALARLIGR